MVRTCVNCLDGIVYPKCINIHYGHTKCFTYVVSNAENVSPKSSLTFNYVYKQLKGIGNCFDNEKL